MKQAFRLLKLIHFQDRTVIPLYMLGAMVKSALPFISIVGGAYVLDSLLQRAWEQAVIQAAVMLFLTAAVGILSSWIWKLIEVKSMTINRQCNQQIILKAISLDYATFEDKKNLEEFQAADYNVAHNGGFGIYMLQFGDLFTGLTGLVFSAALLFGLCMARAPLRGGLGILLSPAGSFFLLGALAVGLSVLYGILSKKINEKNLNMYYEMMDLQQKMHYLSWKLPTDTSLAKEIRLYHMKDMLYREWKHLSIEANGFYRRFWRFEKKNRLLLSLANDVVLLLGYLFVAAKTLLGAVSIGAFTRYVGALSQMNSSLRTVMEAVSQIRLLQSYLSFYTDFLKKENKLDTGSLPVEKRRDNEFEIEFHDVSFRYPGSDEYSLRHVSLKLDMKQRFAVVGRNGAGKTTFVKLLCRLYDVTEGSITLNGVDIRKYDYQEYLNLFAAVFQDFSLFSMSVRDNVACREGAGDERVWEALFSAGVKERIEKMPGKLDTLLFHDMGEGEDISGGEAQKIAIARALYKDAPFVILDEPTAALDPVSEYEVYRRFHEMVRDKTSIYISHRMSSCRFCSDILVFERGQVIQRGSHEELMRDTENVYARLWNAQAKYYDQEIVV